MTCLTLGNGGDVSAPAKALTGFNDDSQAGPLTQHSETVRHNWPSQVPTCPWPPHVVAEGGRPRRRPPACSQYQPRSAGPGKTEDCPSMSDTSPMPDEPAQTWPAAGQPPTPDAARSIRREAPPAEPLSWPKVLTRARSWPSQARHVPGPQTRAQLSCRSEPNMCRSRPKLGRSPHSAGPSPHISSIPAQTPMVRTPLWQILAQVLPEASV